MKNSYKQILLFISSVVLVKIFLSFFIELGNDESYYYTYALQPQLNYFDHPPLVGLLIRFTTINLTFVNDVTLRLGAIICCAIAGVFIFKITKLLYNERAGWFAVLIYNFSIYTGIIAGFFIMPDSLQMPLWCAAIWVMCNIVLYEKHNNVLRWLVLGVIIGLAVLCKIHSLYLWFGFGLFILLYKTKWLLDWRIYFSLLVTAIFCLPILVWNIDNDFITYRFHSNRISNTDIQFDLYLKELIGEILYQNPIIFFGIAMAIFNVKKYLTPGIGAKSNLKPIFNPEFQLLKLLFCLSLPMIFFFWALSFFNEILPHWSGPGYIPLYLLTAVFLAKKVKFKTPGLLISAGILMLTLMVSATIIINFAPFNFGSKSKTNFGENCPTLDLSGWKKFSSQFNEVYQNDVAGHTMKNPVILINKWFPAGQLELYTSTKTKIPIVAVGNLEDVHQFAWLNKIRPELQIGNDAYVIVPSNLPFDVAEFYSGYFAVIEPPQVIEQIRGGSVVRYFYVWRLKNCIRIPPPIL